MENEYSVIALTGTPKSGKTTIFNGLTGMCRYTGGWWGDGGAPGRGTYRYCGQCVAWLYSCRFLCLSSSR